MGKITEKSTKAQIMDAYTQALAELEKLKAMSDSPVENAKKEALEASMQNAEVAASNEVFSDTIVKQYNDLKIAIDEYQKELEGLYGIKAEADGLAAAINAHRAKVAEMNDEYKQKKADLDAELTQKTAEVEEKIADLEKSVQKAKKQADEEVKEYNVDISKKRNREKDEYDYNLYQQGDIVLDGILQVNHCLNKFGIVPDNTDYPDVLQKYLGRKIWADKIDHINNHPELFPIFVKPVVDKKFNGTVVHSIKDLIGCGSCYENSDILCSEIVDFIFECRGFIYYDEMIDLRPYKGNWRNMNLIDTKIIDNAVKDFSTWEGRPNACSLDFGVTKDGRTLLIEQNSAYSLGCYGLYSNYYAKMISAYISQISGTVDECDFRIYR